MTNKLSRWLTYTVMFSVLPLGLAFLARLILKLNTTWNDYSSEFLFAAVILSATTLGDIHLLQNKGIPDIIFTIFQSSLILTVIVGCFCYGVCRVAVEANLDVSSEVVTALSAICFIVGFIEGIAVQIILSKIEKEEE